MFPNYGKPVLQTVIQQLGMSHQDYADAVIAARARLSPPPCEELGRKLAAQIIIADRCAGVIVPNCDEWYGLNLLERDDELRRN